MARQLIDKLGWGIAGAATLTLILFVAGVVSAGPLDPTSPPSSPSGVFGSGTPISSLPAVISSPGSYYLTGNLTGVSGQDGIKIESDDVTLDLRGFTLQGVPGSGDGVAITTGGIYRRAITIKNGTARGWGGSGFRAQLIEGGVFDSLTAEGNGQWGFVLGGTGATLSRCVSTRNGASGISASEATIRGCIVQYNSGHGFQIGRAVVSDCVASHNSFNGFEATQSRIEGCLVWQNGAIGVNASSSQVVANKVNANTGTGIEVTGNGSLVTQNDVQSNSGTGTGYGINVTGTVSRIEDNHVTDVNGAYQDVGIRVVGGENIVIRNSAHDNITNYDLSGPGGTYGPLATAASATNPFTNIDY
jgi:hypothetical protein